VKKNIPGLLFFLLLAAGAARPGQAQQLAQYSQYMNNNYILNPAVAGTEDFIDLKFSYRPGGGPQNVLRQRQLVAG
jgi:hypothetical protein